MKNLATLLLTILSLSDAVPIVHLPNLGSIEGKFATSLKQREFYAFEGIPYAQPPVGDRRFKPPVERKPWKGTWMAKTMYKCMQYDEFLFVKNEDPVNGDEDCLYVNIYSPNLNESANLDVIVYIHGGAFMFLYGGYYGPQYLLDKDVVFVNLNYRLGPLGFLSTEDDVVPGNNGIRDQTLALKFIKNNIQYFGGNPNSITLFGMSAGGASTHIHYLTPASRGLFHRGMSQSGTALNAWVLMENGLEKTQKLASNLGCFSINSWEMIKCLKKRPGKQIVAQVAQFQPFKYTPFSPFGVVVDQWNNNPVLPDHPIEMIENGEMAELPWVVSQTDFEGLYPAVDFLKKEFLEEIDSNWNKIMPFILDYNYTVAPELRDTVSSKIRKEYLQTRKLDKSSMVDFIDILSHRLFDLDIQKTVKLTVQHSIAPVYYYLFKYSGVRSWYDWIYPKDPRFGAAHADDTLYLLSSMPEVPATEQDQKMIDFFVDFMTNYAKTGVPSAPIDWQPVDSSGVIKALTIESPTKLSISTVTTSNEKFWSGLPILENENLIRSNVKDEL